MKLLLVGGGSGGHLYPLFCVADFCIQQKNYSSKDLHFIIADNGSDFEYFAEKKYSYTTFSVAKFRRYISWENIRDFFRFFYNIGKAFWFLKKNQPEKIFSKGGFVSLPFGIAAKILNIPFFLHETDSVMGLSNRILERFATKVFTGFPSNNPHHVFIGNPVRNAFFEEYKKQKRTLPQILVFGGSQGAEALNEWTRYFAKKNPNTAEITLVTGKGKKSEEEIQGITEVEFLHQAFIQAVQQADVIIARAGGSIAELAAAKKCVVLVPLPSAANDHQRKNAELVTQKNAGIWIEQNNLSSDESETTIKNLLANTDLQKKMGEQLFLHFVKNDAVEKIVQGMLGKG